MIVINACINQASGLGRIQSEKFHNKLKTMHVEKYVVVYSVPKFLEALETYKTHHVLLFSNFSPDYFYKKNGINGYDYKEKPMPDWPVKEYGFSAALYYRICREYTFLSIHFITAAYSNMVPDSLLLSTTGNAPSTIKRKQDWTKEGMNYELFLKHYLLRKVREAQNNYRLNLSNYTLVNDK